MEATLCIPKLNEKHQAKQLCYTRTGWHLFQNKTGYVALITNNTESIEKIKILQKLYKHFHSDWRSFWQLLNCMQQSS
jgi:hypothetical protein